MVGSKHFSHKLQSTAGLIFFVIIRIVYHTLPYPSIYLIFIKVHKVTLCQAEGMTKKNRFGKQMTEEELEQNRFTNYKYIILFNVQVGELDIKSITILKC